MTATAERASRWKLTFAELQVVARRIADEVAAHDDEFPHLAPRQVEPAGMVFARRRLEQFPHVREIAGRDDGDRVVRRSLQQIAVDWLGIRNLIRRQPVRGSARRGRSEISSPHARLHP